MEGQQHLPIIASRSLSGVSLRARPSEVSFPACAMRDGPGNRRVAVWSTRVPVRFYEGATTALEGSVIILKDFRFLGL